MEHHKRKGAVENTNQFYEKNGRCYTKWTTLGWDLEVDFQYGATSLVDMKDLNKENILDVSRHSLGNKIMDGPSFN